MDGFPTQRSLALDGKEEHQVGIDDEEVVLTVFPAGLGTRSPPAASLDHKSKVVLMSLQHLVQPLLQPIASHLGLEAVVKSQFLFLLCSKIGQPGSKPFLSVHCHGNGR